MLSQLFAFMLHCNVYKFIETHVSPPLLSAFRCSEKYVITKPFLRKSIFVIYIYCILRGSIFFACEYRLCYRFTKIIVE